MTTESKIANYINSRRQLSKHTVVAICGAADLGKSFLSTGVTNRLTKIGVSAAHLPLDAFLMSRAERIEREISGYQPEAYDFDSILKVLNKYRKGFQVEFYPYNHATGKQENKICNICSCEVLIIEGLHSMHKLLNDHVSLSIFLYTKDENLRKIRLEADKEKRKMSSFKSTKREESEFRKYKKYVEPYKEKAELQIILARKWEYEIQKNTTKRSLDPQTSRASELHVICDTMSLYI